MANAEKTALIEELTGRFSDSSGAVLTEYRGLTVAQLRELRGNLKGNATFTVTKNTLAKVAATNAGLGDQVSSMLSGPSAIAFVDGDVAQAAKGLLDFAKANPLLVIKGGVLDGKALTAAEVGKLADLEPRDVLLAKLAGAMKASMANAAATFNALPTQMALLADALRAKLEAEAPAAEVTAAEAADTETQD
jgi:large subunit ribosomal protein L10